MISSLCSFLSADSESVMLINKTNFSYLLQAISVFYLQKHQHAIVQNDFLSFPFSTTILLNVLSGNFLTII